MASLRYLIALLFLGIAMMLAKSVCAMVGESQRGIALSQVSASSISHTTASFSMAEAMTAIARHFERAQAQFYETDRTIYEAKQSLEYQLAVAQLIAIQPPIAPVDEKHTASFAGDGTNVYVATFQDTPESATNTEVLDCISEIAKLTVDLAKKRLLGIEHGSTQTAATGDSHRDSATALFDADLLDIKHKLDVIDNMSAYRQEVAERFRTMSRLVERLSAAHGTNLATQEDLIPVPAEQMMAAVLECLSRVAGAAH